MLPRKLKSDVRADVVRTVPEMGWASIENGALLHLAELEFDVSLTRDKSLVSTESRGVRFGSDRSGGADE